MVAKYDLSSVKSIICGAAPLSKEMEAECQHVTGESDVRQGKKERHPHLVIHDIDNVCNGDVELKIQYAYFKKSVEETFRHYRARLNFKKMTVFQEFLCTFISIVTIKMCD